MDAILTHPSVVRVTAEIKRLGLKAEVRALTDSARTAQEAADALGINVGQVASSIVFKLDDERTLLVITSGRHRVDTERVAEFLGVEKLGRADADFVKGKSGFAIGGVSPLAWPTAGAEAVTILIDKALNEYEILWAAAGHPHSVFPITYEDLQRVTGAIPVEVSAD